MPKDKPPIFTDNPATRGREMHYMIVTVDPALVLASWRESLFSFEWLTPEGTLRVPADLAPPDRARRDEVERKWQSGETLERPVLGIGLTECIEIGAGKATFLTLAAHGLKTISVHIPRSNEGEFAAFTL